MAVCLIKQAEDQLSVYIYATEESGRGSVTNSGYEDETSQAQGHKLLFGWIITQHAEVALTSNVHPSVSYM
jgi:hypothetical protein